MRVIIAMSWLPLLAACSGTSAPEAQPAIAPAAIVSNAPALALPAEQPPSAADPLVNRIWVRTDVDQPPGTMLIFLSDGSLLQNSCTETYRISRWERAADGALSWLEDAVTIRAEIPALDEGHLTLRVTAPTALRDLHYTASSAAYVCPESPRP